ncbi:hypothetical protein HMPREF3034_01113 [Prevotella sp. DNF00663]|nr:hypothetical protein HMPREF3034_01113 [Prevotella sp. DNF00663]
MYNVYFKKYISFDIAKIIKKTIHANILAKIKILLAVFSKP